MLCDLLPQLTRDETKENVQLQGPRDILLSSSSGNQKRNEEFSRKGTREPRAGPSRPEGAGHGQELAVGIGCKV